MKHQRPNEEAQELASLYALGALSQHEARSFERHLSEGCSVCKAELAAFENVTGSLGLAGLPGAPSAAVKERLLAQIKNEPMSRRLETAPVSAPRISSRRPVVPWAIAAGLALVCAAVFYVWQNTSSELRGARAEIANNAQDIQQLEVQLGSQLSRSEQLQTIVQTLKRPGAKVIQLAVQHKEPTYVAEIYPDETQHRWLVDVALPPAPAGKTYQLWFVKPDPKVSPVSAGLINTDPSGHGFVVVDVPANIGPIAVAAITLEKEGGASTPTMPIIAQAALDAGIH